MGDDICIAGKEGIGLPKDTFFNLPHDKRERVMEAAINEFAERSYHDARITAIVDEAGIAKGSFYQYFEDKKDLFKYIIELAVTKKLEYVNRDMMENMQKYSFFQLLRELYLSGFRFAQEHPRLLAIGMQLQNSQALYYEIFGEHVEKSYAFYEELLKKGMADKELDPEIDLRLAARLLTMFNYALTDLIYEDGKLDYHDMEIIDKMLYIVENGIRRK
jgi:AcrR family transcriptional regulator